MQEVTEDDATNQAQTHDHDPLNTVNNESKLNELSMKPLLVFWICANITDWLFLALAQEEFDYLYSTVKKKKKAPHQPNQEITQTESSKSTAAGINTNKQSIPSGAPCIYN